MKFSSPVMIASLFGMLAGAQPVAVARRNYNEVNADYVVETAYATVTAQPAVQQVAKDGNVVVVTVTETVRAGEQAQTVVQTSAVPVPTPSSSSSAAAVTTPPPVGHAAQPASSPAAQPAVTSVAAATRPAATTSQAVATSTTSQAQETSSSSSGTSSGWQNEMLSQLNSIRAAAGKSAVSLDQRVSSIAQAHSVYQNKVSSMTHSDSAGTLGTRYSARTINWEGAAENIAWNQQTVSEVMTAWKNSAGHYSNMIGDYNYVGFGVDNLYWTQDFLKA